MEETLSNGREEAEGLEDEKATAPQNQNCVKKEQHAQVSQVASCFLFFTPTANKAFESR